MTAASIGGPMTVDLTGGFGDELEFVFATQPDDPDMRESVNAWVWDEGSDFGMPRIGIEAVADQWDTHDLQVNVAFADGRVYNAFTNGPVEDPNGSDGKTSGPRRRPAVLRADRALSAPSPPLRRRGGGQLDRRPTRRRVPRPG